MVFFFDGPVKIKRNDAIYRTRGDAYYSQNILLFNSIYDGLTAGKIAQHMCDSLGGVNTVPIWTTLGKLLKRYGTVLTCKGTAMREYHLEVAAYAQTHQAMAILAQTTEHMIFPNRWQYWSTTYLNLDEFTTKMYNQSALCRKLHLSAAQLALFATLCGNSIISSPLLVDFHRRCGGWNKKFDNIAHVVRQYGHLPLQLMEVVRIEIAAKYISGDVENAPELVRQSIESYDLNRPIVFATKVEPSLPYIDRIWWPYPFSDLRRDDCKEFVSINLAVFRRQMGLIVQQYKDDDELAVNKSCHIEVRQTHDGTYEKLLIDPEYHPTGQ